MKPTDTQQASTSDADICGEMRTMSGQGFNQGEQATGKVWKAVQFRSRDEAIQSLCRVVFGADPVFPNTPPAPATRPPNCRNALRDQGKPHPKSGCEACGDGGLRGCPYETKATEPAPAELTPKRLTPEMMTATPPAPSLADAPKPKRVFLDEVAPYDPPAERPTLITAMEAGAQMGKTTLLSEWAEKTLGTPKGERPKLADKIRHHLQVQFPATEWHIPLKDMLHTVALMEEFYHDEMERNADLERQLDVFRDGADAMHRIAAACQCPSKDAEIAILKGQLDEAREKVITVSDDLAAQLREAREQRDRLRLRLDTANSQVETINSSFERVAEQLAEAREQRDRLADALKLIRDKCKNSLLAKQVINDVLAAVKENQG